MKSIQVFFSLLIFLVVPLSVEAGTVVRTGESVSVEADQTVEEDFYAAGNSVNISGNIGGDMYVAGGSVTANGTVEQDVTIFGQSAQIHASVKDDVRVVAADVVIGSDVGGDVFVIGGVLKVLSTASIAGNVYFYGGEAEISGPVAGSVMGASEKLLINAPVAGDVDVTSGLSFELGDRASVQGSVRYKSEHDLIRAQNAVVEGEVTKNDRRTGDAKNNLGNSLTPFFVSLFAALCLYLLFKTELQNFTNITLTGFGRSALVGFAALILTPIAVLLFIVTILGALVGLTGLFVFLATVLAALVLTNIMLGALISRLFGKQFTVNLLSIVAGAVAVQVLWAIPVFGVFALGVLFVTALGGLFYQMYRFVT
jgi:hypothetical protein